MQRLYFEVILIIPTAFIVFKLTKFCRKVSSDNKLGYPESRPRQSQFWKVVVWILEPQGVFISTFEAQMKDIQVYHCIIQHHIHQAFKSQKKSFKESSTKYSQAYNFQEDLRYYIVF